MSETTMLSCATNLGLAFAAALLQLFSGQYPVEIP